MLCAQIGFTIDAEFKSFLFIQSFFLVIKQCHIIYTLKYKFYIFSHFATQ